MAAVKYKRILLKLSGEALMGEQEFGISPELLGRLSDELVEIQQLGVELALVVGWNEQQGPHDRQAPELVSGRLRMNACRRQTATSSPDVLCIRCSKSTMPASGRERLCRVAFTSVSTLTVSP